MVGDYYHHIKVVVIIIQQKEIRHIRGISGSYGLHPFTMQVGHKFGADGAFAHVRGIDAAGFAGVQE